MGGSDRTPRPGKVQEQLAKRDALQQELTRLEGIQNAQSQRQSLRLFLTNNPDSRPGKLLLARVLIKEQTFKEARQLLSTLDLETTYYREWDDLLKATNDGAASERYQRKLAASSLHDVVPKEVVEKTGLSLNQAYAYARIQGGESHDLRGTELWQVIGRTPPPMNRVIGAYLYFWEHESLQISNDLIRSWYQSGTRSDRKFLRETFGALRLEDDTKTSRSQA